MIEFLKRNAGLAVILLIWVFSGIQLYEKGLTIISTGIILGTVLLLKRKNRLEEIYWGFLFVLMMSDSRFWYMAWAADVKNYYILLLAAFYILDNKSFPYPNRLFWAFIPMFIWAFALVYRNPEPSLCFQKTLSYALLWICLPPYFIKILIEKGNGFIRDTVFFIAWMLALGLLIWPINPNFVNAIGRYNGLLGNPNAIGIYCTVFFFLFYIGKSRFPQLFSKADTLIIYLLIILSLIFSGSRNAMMSILLFTLFSRFHKASPVLSFALLLLAGLTYQLFLDNVGSIIQSLGLQKELRAETISEASGRLIAWRFAWEHIQNNFFVGMGWDYDVHIFMKYQRMLMMMGHNGGVHNVAFGFWLTLGLVGVLLFFFGLFYTFIKAASKSPFAIPMLYGTLFSITFEAWLMGSLNPYTNIFLLSLVVMTYEPQPAIVKSEPHTRFVPVL